jgi:2-keto-4-pentenoate hydratase/2-oxohepta-3-ene-1,7-dioic acid hydratase in catechol pathway
VKLASIQSAGEDRAGIVIGDEVLDVTRFLADSNEPDSDSGREAPISVFEDAIALLGLGIPFLTGIVDELTGDAAIAGRCRETGVLIRLADLTLNAPVLRPGKILAVGLNYAAHAAEQNAKRPEVPLVFTKCVTSLQSPRGVIRLPRISEMIDYEAELAVVVGKPARSVAASEAFDRVAGYIVMNDVSARDIQRRERQWTRAKGLDTFAPCGPWLVTADEIPDPHSLDIELRVNGELRQKSNTNDLIFKIPELIEFISQDLTLLPGDIISTGTPSGVGVFRDPPVFLKPGDEVAISIDHIGEIRNRVVEPDAV